jgi:membrane-bound lytic murein transglycosylase D
MRPIGPCLLFVFVCLILPAAVSGSEGTPFPHPAELEPDIRFWTRVFAVVDTRHGLIHDARHLDVVYEVIKLPAGLGRHARDQRVKRAKARYRKILLTLAKGKRKDLSAEERRVLGLWPEGVGNKALRQAAGRIRFQLGQSDRFRAGLIRSGAWRPYMEQTLEANGVPKALVALPHVESSFNPEAYSHVGAAGLWQFTRSTGRRYMRVDHVVDERRDPYLSTEAAARLLRHNHEITGTWPLAITAYNHGAAGMRRAARRLGSTDIDRILRRYHARTFGFASRNFYVAFLAALDVDREAEHYFGPLEKDPPERSRVVQVPDYLSASTLQGALGIPLEGLRRHNPALGETVWSGTKFVPRGYGLRVACPFDCTGMREQVIETLAAIPTSERYVAQRPDRFHKVRRGQSLSMIAARYGVRMHELVALNGLRSRNRIRAGQVLRLPQAGAANVPTVLASGSVIAKAAPLNPMPEDGQYTVRRGDSLAAIAGRFGMQTEELARINRLEDRNRIYPGQALRVAAVETAQEPGPATQTPAESPIEIVGQAPRSGAAQVAMAELPGDQDTEALGPTLPEELHPDLSADPSDYTVASDGTIEVQGAETLGHYADWLGLRTQRLRNLNKLPFGQPLAIGKRLRLDFSRISPERFEQRRIAYHRQVQARFFRQYRIKDTRTHVVKQGESLWRLTSQRYRVPVWLFRQYNPDLRLSGVRAGSKLIFPVIERRRETPSPLGPSVAAPRPRVA